MCRFHVSRSPRGWQVDALAVATFVTAGLVAYANTFESGFYFDGESMEKGGLRQLSGSVLDWLRPPPRTIGYLTFDAQYSLHGLWFPGFHAVNLAIHIAATTLLYWIVKRTILLANFCEACSSAASGIGLATALVFELHPLQTQSVTYLYQRFESLMGMFFLAAIFCFVWAIGSPHRYRQLGWFSLAWFCVLLSALTKEVGVMAPPVMLWLDRAVFAKSWAELVRKRWWFYFPTFPLAVAAVIFLVRKQELYASGGILTTAHVGVLEYALSQPAVILHYLRLFFWPQGQCLDYVWPPADSWSEILPALAGLLIIFTGVAWATVRLPWLGFSLGSVFVILAPTSSFLPIVDLAFEHRMYLPVAGLSTATIACVWWFSGWVLDRFNLRSVPVAAQFAPALLWATLLGCVTFARNEVYRDGVSLWQNVLEVQPGNARAYNNLAWHVETQLGDSQWAIALNQRALAIKPDIASAHRALAELLSTTNHPQAVFHAREAIRAEPSNWENANNLGILLAAEDPVEAEKLFEQAIELTPLREKPYLNLTNLLSQQQRFEEAVTVLKAGLEKAANAGISWPLARQRLGMAVQQLNQSSSADSQPTSRR